MWAFKGRRYLVLWERALHNSPKSGWGTIGEAIVKQLENFDASWL